MEHVELQAWLVRKFGAEKFRPGLERVGGFLRAELTAVQALNPRIITVAGTNGKGETAMTLARLAKARGESYVLWTSPHLLRVTERFQSEVGEIPVADLREFLEAVEHDARAEGVGLSYYEILFCAFLRWGLKRSANLWIMEVGLGGRLDAVNLLDASTVVLTSISRDHQEFLGNRYSEILHEKLGVLRPGATLFSALESRYLRELTERFCHRLGVTWQDLFIEGALNRESSFSQRNRRLAETVSGGQKLGQKDDASVVFAGRGEKWRWANHEFTFYGSHNPDGVRKLVQLVSQRFYTNPQENFHQIWAAFSQRTPKDLLAMVRMLAALASPRTRVCLTQFDHPKAARLDEWWKSGEGSPVQTFHEWTELLKDLPPAPAHVLVTGSYYFVATLQSHLLELGAVPSSGG